MQKRPETIADAIFPVLGPAIRSGDRAKAGAFRELYEARHGRELVGFRLEDRQLVIGTDGVSEGPVLVVGCLYFDGDGCLP